VYDVGCGDGRVLIQMASKSIPAENSQSNYSSQNDDKLHHCHQFIGIEISQSRAEEARNNIEKARMDKLISNHVKVEIICANALEVDYSPATVVFLYLVPRGLRLIQPVLRSDTENNSLAIQKQQRPKRIISYMNPIEKETTIRKEYCKVGNVEGAAFPIYLYHI
jgi:SAM-dependent methyltransferase